MTPLYYLERYTILAAGFIVCGVLSLFFSFSGNTSAEFPYTAVFFLAAGAAGIMYVLRHRKDTFQPPYFPKIDERELLVIFKASWVVQEIAILVLLFTALDAAPLLGMIAGEISASVVSAVQVLLMGLVVLLALVYLIAHMYFERRV